MQRVCGKTSNAYRCLWICCLLARCLIYIIRSINISNEYSALSTSACLVGLVRHSNEIVKKIQAGAASKRQCSVLHVGSIWFWEYRLFKLLIDWCAIAFWLSITLFAPIEWNRQTQNKCKYKYSWQPPFFFSVSVLCRSDCRVPCECQDSFQFESAVKQAALLEVTCCYSCFCAVIQACFLIFYGTAAANSCIWWHAIFVKTCPTVACNVFFSQHIPRYCCLHEYQVEGGRKQLHAWYHTGAHAWFPTSGSSGRSRVHAA